MKRLSILIFIAGIGSAVPAFGGAMAGGASEITQILNNVQLTLSYLEQVSQTAQQLEQLKTQIEIHKIHIENARRLSQGDIMIIEQYARQLWEYRQRQNGYAWTASEVDKLYRQRYPSYEEIMAGALDGQSLPDLLKKWNEETNKTLKDVLEANAKDRERIDGEETIDLNKIIDQSGNAAGDVQLLQLANNIASKQIEQIQDLKKLIIRQTDTIAHIHAAEKSNELAVAEKLSKMHAPIEFKEKTEHRSFWPKFPNRKRRR